MEFALLDSSLASVQNFLTMPLSSFGMVMDIMCHYMLEICNWVLCYRKFQIKDGLESQKRFWIFELCQDYERLGGILKLD